MANRFKHAVDIQAGACNPSGVCHSLLDAIRQAREEGADTAGVCNDSAVRAIAHQLSFLLNIHAMDDDTAEYRRVMDECAKRAESA